MLKVMFLRAYWQVYSIFNIPGLLTNGKFGKSNKITPKILVVQTLKTSYKDVASIEFFFYIQYICLFYIIHILFVESHNKWFLYFSTD